MTLRRGKTVELNNGDFLRIDRILQAITTEVFLLGRRFRRTTRLGGIVTGQPNEVCWIEEKFQDGFSIAEEVPLAHVVRLRQLRLTNKAYKDLSIRNTMAWPPTNKLYQKEGILFCRIKYEVTYTSQAQKLKARSFSFVDKCIRGLYSAEVDGEYWEDPADLRAAWRGAPASLVERLRRSVSTVTLVGDDQAPSQDTGTRDAHPKVYTFGDCFCGGGGMSCGAKLAGLAVTWGLDFDRQAIRTYQLNFEGASCENTSVDHFLNANIFPSNQYHVDVLHMSPPCQSFSPAQVVKPEDFEDKQVVILAVNDLVKKVKPRIITMEETFGLLHPVNREFLNSVVNSLVEQGYSVRWKVMNFGEYGVPQKRRRLVLIASGYVQPPPCSLHVANSAYRPGETLPDFPQPTHVNGFASINSVISNIPPGTPNHTAKEFEFPRRAYNGNGLLQSLIACGGGLDNYHPDGKRPFTEREFACLQTFPLGRPSPFGGCMCGRRKVYPLIRYRLQIYRQSNEHSQTDWQRGTALAGQDDL